MKWKWAVLQRQAAHGLPPRLLRAPCLPIQRLTTAHLRRASSSSAPSPSPSSSPSSSFSPSSPSVSLSSLTPPCSGPPRLFHSSSLLRRQACRQFSNSAQAHANSEPESNPPSPPDPSASSSSSSSSSPPSSSPSSATEAASSPPLKVNPNHTKRKPRSTPKDSLRRLANIAQGRNDNPSSSSSFAAAAKPSRPPNNATTTAAAASPALLQPTVSAVCLGEGFDMARVLDTLTSHGFHIDPYGTGFDATEVIHARGLTNGDIFVFPSGTFVTWSADPETITRALLQAVTDPYLESQRESEDLEYTSDVSTEKCRLRNDTITLGTQRESARGDRLNTTLAKIAFSTGLARSTQLGVLESALTAYFDSTRHIPGMLASGSFKLSRHFINQKTGELLGLRARLNYYSQLTDSAPDIFWESKPNRNLEDYYELVGHELDVQSRINRLNKNMDYAHEISDILRQMAAEKHSTRLEVIIIILIAVEVVLQLKIPDMIIDYVYEHILRDTFLDIWSETGDAASTSS